MLQFTNIGPFRASKRRNKYDIILFILLIPPFQGSDLFLFRGRTDTERPVQGAETDQAGKYKHSSQN